MTNQQYQTERWSSIDAIKGLAAMAVVFIHVLFPEPLKLAVKSMARFSVPVFFMTSGFFYLYNGSIRLDRCIHKLRHIIRITAAALIFYLFFYILYYRALDPQWSPAAFLRERYTAGKTVVFLLTNEPSITWHLWFLFALFYVYLFALLYFTDERRLKTALPLGLMLMICYSLLDEFASLLGIHSSFAIPESSQRIKLSNLFLFRGLPFFCFGIAMRLHADTLKAQRSTTKSPLLLLLFLLGTVLAPLECRWTRDLQFYVGNILASVSLMLWAVQSRTGGSSLLIHIGRDLSLYTYVLHIAVMRMVFLLQGSLAGRVASIFIRVQPVIVLLITLLISEVLFRIVSAAKHHQHGSTAL